LCKLKAKWAAFFMKKAAISCAGQGIINTDLETLPPANNRQSS